MKVDFRLVTATNRDLAVEIGAGRFRQDLFYRLNVITIAMPSLRDRAEDIPALAAYFLERFCREEKKPLKTIDPASMELLERYSWPGNVRQLENANERVVRLDRSGTITPDILPPEIVASSEGHDATGGLGSLQEHERRYILAVLAAAGNNRSKAARILGLDRSSLWRKLKEYGTE